MVVDGFELAAQEFEEKRGDQPLASKQAETIGEESFLQLPKPQDVDGWLEASSTIETQTTRKQIDLIYERAFSYWDEDLQRGLTPREIARAIEDEGLALTRSRSELLARTTTQWCYNEGAHQQYIDLGVASEIWMVTDDDVLCDWCSAMDGVKVPTEEAFFSAGSRFEVESEDKVRALEFPFDVQHPPLHPYCRCVVIPNL
jgi:hypothetical protein